MSNMLPILTNHRRVTPEIMDGPGITEGAHLSALNGLRRINRASKAVHYMMKPIIAMARRENLKRVSMLDVACGGGDVPIGVAVRAQNAGVEIDLTLLDRSATALQNAAAAAERAGIACRCVQADLLTQRQELSFDVVTCSLFLHHIPEPGQVVDFLKKMQAMARRQVVISDLRRSRCGFVIARIGTRLLSRSPVVHYDGPISVRAAWTIGELADFAARAQMNGVRIHRCWPWRMLLVWEPIGANAA